MPHWEVSKEESGLKLSEFIKRKMDSKHSQKQIKRLIDAGQCKINGKAEKFSSARVGFGDTIEFEITANEIKEGSILYEDEHLLVFNKPAKTSVESLEKDLGYRLIHRLDKDTTGALLLAKSETVFKKMVQQFVDKSVHKTYLTLVDGNLNQKSGTIENTLGKLKEWQGQSLWGKVPSGEGEYALTHWKCLQNGPECALLECHPVTGRTHQIRAHCAGMGHPILGDSQYGHHFRCPYKAPRTLLHAFKLQFLHPFNPTSLTIEAPLPDDFNTALQTLWKRL